MIFLRDLRAKDECDTIFGVAAQTRRSKPQFALAHTVSRERRSFAHESSISPTFPFCIRHEFPKPCVDTTQVMRCRRGREEAAQPVVLEFWPHPETDATSGRFRQPAAPHTVFHAGRGSPPFRGRIGALGGIFICKVNSRIRRGEDYQLDARAWRASVRMTAVPLRAGLPHASARQCANRHISPPFLPLHRCVCACGRNGDNACAEIAECVYRCRLYVKRSKQHRRSVRSSLPCMSCAAQRVAPRGLPLSHTASPLVSVHGSARAIWNTLPFPLYNATQKSPPFPHVSTVLVLRASTMVAEQERRGGPRRMISWRLRYDWQPIRTASWNVTE